MDEAKLRGENALGLALNGPPSSARTWMEVAKRHREALWKKLVKASVELERAEGELGEQIRQTMAEHWTPEQIAAAMESAGDGKEGA